MPGGQASRPGTPNPCLRQDLKVSGLVTTRQKSLRVVGWCRHFQRLRMANDLRKGRKWQ